MGGRRGASLRPYIGLAGGKGVTLPHALLGAVANPKQNK